MPAGASLERFGEKYIVFINWRLHKHSFKNEWILVTYFPWVRILFNNLQFMSFMIPWPVKIYLFNKQVGLAEFLIVSPRTILRTWKKVSPDIKILLDFAIFSILSYQCDIIRYNHIISQNSLYNFSKFSL